MNGEKTTAARKLFESIIKKHQAYDSQICICSNTFRRELMIPILAIIKELEEQADE